MKEENLVKDWWNQISVAYKIIEEKKIAGAARPLNTLGRDMQNYKNEKKGEVKSTKINDWIKKVKNAKETAGKETVSYDSTGKKHKESAPTAEEKLSKVVKDMEKFT